MDIDGMMYDLASWIGKPLTVQKDSDNMLLFCRGCEYRIYKLKKSTLNYRCDQSTVKCKCG